MNSPKFSDRSLRSKRNKQWSSQEDTTEIDLSEDESMMSSQAQILERVKSDRATLTQPEEDRRRRTIIVEKNNGSFGFTLQSYGIHYKKEQEIEMITYVDYVDYDGPAYRAGMREGDVILSINGHDMEKTDHKTLVNFIKSCDSRMRMVVLFEDCVRKVELHMRYIQIQRALRAKMLELEQVCLHEREILEGRWKTHSLPARKKASASNSINTNLMMHPPESGGSEYAYCRPAQSQEDVAKTQPHLVLAYQYLDPRYRYVLRGQSAISTLGSSNSGEYLVTWNEQPQTSHQLQQQQHHVVMKQCSRGYQQPNGVPTKEQAQPPQQQTKSQKGRHLCPPCIRANQGDNGSLDAYDLASPCCDSHCVPTRRRSSQNKEKGHKESKRSSSRSSSQSHSQHQSQSKAPPQQPQQAQQSHPSSHPSSHRYISLGGISGVSSTASGLVSQCSLHSCVSWSDRAASPNTATATATSLSSDTLYWDDSLPQQQLPANTPLQSYVASCEVYNSGKPKSWDNLTTKAFGGYGFGYGYLDCTIQHKGGPPVRTHSTKTRSGCSEEACGRRYYVVASPAVANRSTESLLAHTDSSASCECLDLSQQSADLGIRGFFSPEKTSKHAYAQQQQQQQLQYELQSQMQAQQMQQQRDMASQTDCKTPVGDVMRL